MKTIRVKVKTKAHASVLDGPDAGDTWQARLKSPPVDGNANEELITLVAQYFACPKSVVSIKSGATSRMKQVQITLPGINKFKK